MKVVYKRTMLERIAEARAEAQRIHRDIEKIVLTASGGPFRGWSADALEAQAFAFLAVRSMRGLPITFPATSGGPPTMSSTGPIDPRHGRIGRSSATSAPDASCSWISGSGGGASLDLLWQPSKPT